ncbi:hypothetical protein CYMTET_15966, partial [Cymbomonas tetramitiformis]
ANSVNVGTSQGSKTADGSGNEHLSRPGRFGEAHGDDSLRRRVAGLSDETAERRDVRGEDAAGGSHRGSSSPAGKGSSGRERNAGSPVRTRDIRRRTGFSDAIPADHEAAKRAVAAPVNGAPSSLNSPRDLGDSSRHKTGTSRGADLSGAGTGPARKPDRRRRTGFSDEPPADTEPARRTGFSDGPVPSLAFSAPDRSRRTGFSDTPPPGALREALARRPVVPDVPPHSGRADLPICKSGFSDAPPMVVGPGAPRWDPAGRGGADRWMTEKGGGGRKGGRKGGAGAFAGRGYVHGAGKGGDDPHFSGRAGGFASGPGGRGSEQEATRNWAGFADVAHVDKPSYGGARRAGFPSAGSRGELGGAEWHRGGFGLQRGPPSRHRGGALGGPEEEPHGMAWGARWNGGTDLGPSRAEEPPYTGSGAHSSWGGGAVPALKDAKGSSEARSWSRGSPFTETPEALARWTDGKGRVLAEADEGRDAARGDLAWQQPQGVEPYSQWEQSFNHGAPSSSSVAAAVDQGVVPVLPASTAIDDGMSMALLGQLSAEEESVKEWHYMVPESETIYGPCSVDQLHEWEQHLPTALPIWKEGGAMVLCNPGKRQMRRPHSFSGSHIGSAPGLLNNGNISSRDNSEGAKIGHVDEERALESGTPGSFASGIAAQEGSPEDETEEYFRRQVTTIVKAALHSSWEKGQLTRESFKAVCRSAVDKVMGAHGRHAFPTTPAVDEFLTAAQKAKVASLARKCEKYHHEKLHLQ